MKKRFFALFFAGTLIVWLLSGCGAGAKESMRASQNEVMRDNSVQIGGEAGGKNALTYSLDDTSESYNGVRGTTTTGGETSVSVNEAKSDAKANAGNSTNNILLSQRKVIRSATVSIEIENFDKTYGRIMSMVEMANIGYIQKTSFNKDGDMATGVIEIRVEADKFPKILNGIKGLGKVLEFAENTDDVTDKFYDVESELRLLKYEQMRLEEYLYKLKKPSDIFETQSRLTDIRHQIENLTVNLKKLGSLVELSTITINVTEKSGNSIGNEERDSYISKLTGSFLDSLKSVGNFFSGFLLVVAAILPVMIVVGVLIICAFILFRKKIKGKFGSASIRQQSTDENIGG